MAFPFAIFSIRALREQIAMVTQESFLFNGTIRENLHVGKWNASDKRIVRISGSGKRPGLH